LTYLDQDGKMHRVSKGAPEQVIWQQCLHSFILKQLVLCIVIVMWSVHDI